MKFLLFGNDGFTVDAQNKLVAPADSALVVRKPLQAFIPDARHAVLAAVLIGNAPLDTLAKGSSAVHDVLRDRTFDNATVTITGTPTFLTDINNYLQGGMFVLGGIAVLVMMVILLVAFKVRWRLLPLVGMAVGIIWGFGAFGFTGTKLSLVTIAGLPILIGLGIEFAIQIQNRIEEERGVEHSGNPFERDPVGDGPATGRGDDRCRHRLPDGEDLEGADGAGLRRAAVDRHRCSADCRRRHSDDADRMRASAANRRPRSRSRAGSRQPSIGSGACRAWLCCHSSCSPSRCRCLGLIMETGSKIESDPINWANQSSTSIKNARILEKETGFATTLGVFVETKSAPANGVFTDQMGAFVFDLVDRSTNENPELAGASSLATTVGWLAEVPNTTSLPPTGLDMLEAYNVAPTALRGLLVADNGNATQVLFQVGPSSLEQRAAVLDKMHLADRRSRQRRAPAGSGFGHDRWSRRRRCRAARRTSPPTAPN